MVLRTMAEGGRPRGNNGSRSPRGPHQASPQARVEQRAITSLSLPIEGVAHASRWQDPSAPRPDRRRDRRARDVRDERAGARPPAYATEDLLGARLERTGGGRAHERERLPGTLRRPGPQRRTPPPRDDPGRRLRRCERDRRRVRALSPRVAARVPTRVEGRRRGHGGTRRPRNARLSADRGRPRCGPDDLVGRHLRRGVQDQGDRDRGCGRREDGPGSHGGRPVRSAGLPVPGQPRSRRVASDFYDGNAATPVERPERLGP